MLDLFGRYSRLGCSRLGVVAWAVRYFVPRYSRLVGDVEGYPSLETITAQAVSSGRGAVSVLVLCTWAHGALAVSSPLCGRLSAGSHVSDRVGAFQGVSFRFWLRVQSTIGLVA